MPFTPAHAVVALPFLRTPLAPAAIAVGAMTPDLPLFVRGTPLTYQVTHTNLLVTGLIGVALLLIWWGVLRPAVREFSPRWLAARLPEGWDAVGLDIVATLQQEHAGARHPIWREPSVGGILLAISLMLGIVSHIVWDAFTHEGRWGVHLVPALAAEWGPLVGYKWLQHGSSIVGVTVLALAGAVWLARRGHDQPVSRVLPSGVRWVWWLSLPGILTVAWFAGLAAFGPLTPDFTPQHLGHMVLPPACAVWGGLTFALCVVVQVRRRR